MAKVKYYAKENSTIGTHSFYAVPIPNGTRNERSAAKRGRQVEQLTLDGHHVAFYQSASEASRQTGVGRKNINECLCLRSQTAGGYRWKFKEQ